MKKLINLISLLLIVSLCLSSCSSYEAPEWDIYADDWHTFRGTAENIAVTHSETPKSASDTSLDWVFDAGSRTAGLLYIDGFVVTFSGDTLYKIDADTGALALSAQLYSGSGHSSVSPAYNGGVLYIAADGGIVQAVDFETFETLWVYENDLGGQALSPVMCAGGYVCTGFWNGETEDADFVFLDLDGNETSKYTNKGGFYLAGAVEADGYAVVPSDNGASPANGASESLVMSFDPRTGELRDSFPIEGDGRSSAVYFNSRVYVVSKPGVLYSAAIDDGMFSDIRSVRLDGECTASPVIYGDYAFVGTSAKTVQMIDLSSMEVTASADTGAYPQAAMLLSDAYVEQDGCVYIYAALNALPGGISVIKADIFRERLTVSALFDAAGYEQYCFCAPICSGGGTIYYANDSGAVFSLSQN